jgi:hypothetical protein
MLIRCIDCGNNIDGECSFKKETLDSFLLTNESFINCVSGTPLDNKNDLYKTAETAYKYVIQSKNIIDIIQNEFSIYYGGLSSMTEGETKFLNSICNKLK